MKIVCDNCATKYSIADDKVRGKVFKIRCKKCSHIIVVRGTGDGAVGEPAQAVPSSAVSQEPSAKFSEKATKVFDYAGAESETAAAAGAGPAPDGAIWHLVIDREQVGPMTADDVRARFARGEVDGETYAWREGFADWQKLGALSDFGDLMAAPPAAAAGYGAGSGVSPQGNEPADLFASSPSQEAAEEGLFASAPASTLDSRSPFAHATGGQGQEAHSDLLGGGALAAGGGLFASPAAAPADDSGGLFGSAAAREPAAGGSGRVEVRPMTGQRNENSVLFSLGNLQALAMSASKDGGAAAASGGSARPGHASSKAEGSGLIDIRAMAASTLGGAAASAPAGVSASEDDLPAFGGSAFSPVAAPVLLPVAQPAIPKWVWGFVAGGGVLLITVVIMVVLIMRRSGQPTIAQVAPPSVIAPTPGLAPAPPTAEKKAGTTAATPDEKKADTAAADDKKGAGKKVASSSRHHGSRGGGPAASAGLPETAPSLGKSDQPLAPTRRKEKAGGDELDRLLERAVGGAGHSAPAAPQPREDPLPRAPQQADPNKPDQPGRSDIQHGMSSVKPKVNACYAQYNVPGTVFVSVTISPSGKVQNASAKGNFGGTPTGSCVERAVRSASFPSSKNGVTIDYPFLLSK